MWYASDLALLTSDTFSIPFHESDARYTFCRRRRVCREDNVTYALYKSHMLAGIVLSCQVWFLQLRKE